MFYVYNCCAHPVIYVRRKICLFHYSKAKHMTRVPNETEQACMKQSVDQILQPNKRARPP